MLTSFIFYFLLVITFILSSSYLCFCCCLFFFFFFFFFFCRYSLLAASFIIYFLWNFTGADSEGVRGVRRVQWNPALTQNFIFHGKFWDFLIKMGYCFYPKYSHPLLFTVYFSSASPFYYLQMSVKMLDVWQTVKIQIRRRVLWRLIWVYTVCSGLSFQIRRLSTEIWSNRTPSEIILDPPHL